MTDLNFTGFSDFERKLKFFVKKNNAYQQFKTCKLNCLKEMINQFDFEKHNDVDQLSYLMWRTPKDFEKLLNDGFLLDKIGLDLIANKITKRVPELNIIGFSGFTPIGGFTASINDSLSYYNCIKFIGQFTNNQEVYDKCLQILEILPSKLKGPIKNPQILMNLMNYNNYVDTSNNKYKKMIEKKRFDKYYDFYHSIYCPDPCHNSNYDRYNKDIIRTAHNIAIQTNNTIDYVFLLTLVIKTYYYMIKNTNDLHFVKKFIPESSIIIISDIICDIDKQVYCENNQEITQKIQSRINKKINERLRFISKNDDEIWNIFINAFVYVSDEKYDIEIMRRDLLLEVYKRQLVDIDSKLSHNLMRNAVNSGRLWIVKFLIASGCSTKNLPEYGQWDWDLESLQLKDILERKLTNRSGFPKNVYDYLIEGNYI
ncbi:hypothetical protein QJ850_gp921 [Acanthamoeba polyphaga mimivirus]|uniref:Uncharacterized protein n=1 Tax=Acanthamoeba polyphaga mimivirus Kroon TaxID=3069720 RepID=A0A0G2Y223_9VIRU|nr:hypothetical protein QJ850_gp921 [Acanthamoeba polyphaga mimivirus]AKI79778.1 hypothetical protein [Acanthamoeba polyphaga mimivirus Kroon]